MQPVMADYRCGCEILAQVSNAGLNILFSQLQAVSPLTFSEHKGNIWSSHLLTLYPSELEISSWEGW